MCAIHAVHALSSAVTNLTNKTLIFHDFQGLTIKFRDFPGLENEILKFHDFPGFSWPVWTLQWDWVFPVSRGLFSPVVGRWEKKRPPAEYQGKETSVQPHSRGGGGGTLMLGNSGDGLHPRGVKAHKEARYQAKTAKLKQFTLGYEEFHWIAFTTEDCTSAKYGSILKITQRKWV